MSPTPRAALLLGAIALATLVVGVNLIADGIKRVVEE